MTSKSPITYSVVIPIKDEESNIEELFQELHPVMDSLKKDWELIFIDDGSTDNSARIIRGLQKKNPCIRLIQFSKNYGQTCAFDAGFKAALGQYTITLDGDRQNDPADIPQLIAAMDDYDLVSGWRQKRNDPWTKKFQSKIANGIRSRVCRDEMHDTGCSLKIYKTECLKQIKLFRGMHRFLPALFKIEGFRIKETPVNHRERVKGQTKYHFFSRLIGPLVDMLAVLWMRSRRLNYNVERKPHE